MKNPGTRVGHKNAARERAAQRTRSHQTPVVRTPVAPSELTRCQDPLGRVLVSGEALGPLEDAIRRRIANVSARARFTQPERRLIDVRGSAREGFEIRTTSQELAHRIARELEKAFGGRSSYSWADGDGGLLARWQAPAADGRLARRKAR